MGFCVAGQMSGGGESLCVEEKEEGEFTASCWSDCIKGSDDGKMYGTCITHTHTHLKCQTV